MSELAAEREQSRGDMARGTITCFCEDCERLLYINCSDPMFCPVCSSALLPAEPALLQRATLHRSVNRR